MYGDTAEFYDRLTNDIDYGRYADYFTGIFKRHMEKMPLSVVDLGCGTGNLTLDLSEKGYDMTGVDGSSAMLSGACSKKGHGILWINQDLTELDLFGTYEAAVSLMDCVNHLLDEEMVRKYLKRLHYFIEPGGLFVFDINTEYKFRHVYGDNVFYSVDEGLSYIWQNHFDANTGICTMDMTFFEKYEDTYIRIDSVNKEKVYSREFIENALKEGGYAIEAVYDDLTFSKPTDESQRIFFVCRRI